MKVSYTILNAWAQGRYEDAVKYYFKLDVIQTPAMLEGSRFHKMWEEETMKTKSLPKVFGDKKMNDPKVENYLRVRLNDWLELSGKIDCFDSPVIYEYKSGKQTSEDIVRSFQPGVYGVLATLSNMYADRCEIYCFNQHLSKDNKSMSTVYITDKILEDSLNWIETLAGEMNDYFITNSLYEKYGQGS